MLEWLYGIPAFVIFVIGIIALIKKPRILSGYAQALVGWIPGGVKMGAIIAIAIGLVFGGIAGGSLAWSKLKGTVSDVNLPTGAIGSNGDVPITLSSVECEFSSGDLNTVAGSQNSTFRSDKTSRQHYYVDVENATEAVDDGINGTLSCKRPVSGVGEDAAIVCYVEAESFRSEVSSTDSNTYYILSTGTTASKVPGFTWEQSAYLNDNAVATTSSDKEETTLVFSESEAEQKLGYYLTLPGTTIINYLDEQSSRDVKIVCGGQEVFRFTITKLKDS